jgi:pimeloyl-ACP methyl ester carboxylesterase
MARFTVRVPSTDGVDLALHHLSDTEPGSLPILLISHATGFHGHCYLPVAKYLEERFDCWAHDHRGYGDSLAPHDWQVRWEAYGEDSLAAVEYLTSQVRSGHVLAAGHSMGGATLIMAALHRPALFRGIVAFEPIVFPQANFRPDDMPPNPLVAATRKRRATFDSFDDAYANFASKPPMAAFHPDALRAYVDHGFLTNHDGSVTLKCNPEHEARTYETGGGHQTWNDLVALQVPVWVVGSPEQTYQPSAIAPRIAEQLRRGHYEMWPEVSHFGPMEDPARFAEYLAFVASKLP